MLSSKCIKNPIEKKVKEMTRVITLPHELAVACYQVIGQLPANQVAKIIIHLGNFLEENEEEFQLNEIAKKVKSSGDFDRHPDDYEPITPEG